MVAPGTGRAGADSRTDWPQVSRSPSEQYAPPALSFLWHLTQEARGCLFLLPSRAPTTHHHFRFCFFSQLPCVQDCPPLEAQSHGAISSARGGMAQGS